MTCRLSDQRADLTTCPSSQLSLLGDTALSVSIVLDYLSLSLLYTPSLVLYLLPGSAVTSLFSGCTMLGELWLQLIMPCCPDSINLSLHHQVASKQAFHEMNMPTVLRMVRGRHSFQTSSHNICSASCLCVCLLARVSLKPEGKI